MQMRGVAASIFGAVFSVWASSAAAGALLVNGGFELTTNGGGQIGGNTNLSGWSINLGAGDDLAFVFPKGTADTTGVRTITGSTVRLWGPGNHTNNGLTLSPDGGNFIGEDAGLAPEAIYQTLHTIAGHRYRVSFDYAGAQQEYHAGPQTESWIVNLGPTIPTDREYTNFELPEPARKTPVLSNLSRGFTGWHHETMTFTATSDHDILSFMAEGTPHGVPPFALLDGVSVSPVNVGEPVAAPFAASLAALAWIVRRRR